MQKMMMVVLLGCLVAGCGGEQKGAEDIREDGPLTVAAVNYPLAYFAERIGGGLVEVVYPIPPEVDPAFWNPSAEGIAAFQEADLVLLNGADYAKWVPKATLAAGRLVDTSAAFADRYIMVEGAVSHAHGPGGEHAHAGVAFTTWLDFQQAIQQAAAVGEALAAHRPQLSGQFRENYAALEADLLKLDARLAALVPEGNEQPVVASHPVFQYLARRYGLDLMAVTWEPEEVPGQAQWSELEEILSSHPARWMIWEGEPAPESRTRLEALGVRSLVFDPCMNRREHGDFLRVMQDNITSLEAVFE